MNDEIIQIPANPQIKPPAKQNLVYLALFEDNKIFLATKFEQTQFCVKLIGIFIYDKKQEMNKIVETHQDIITKNLTENKDKFVEIHVPWTKLQYVRNLMFKQK